MELLSEILAHALSQGKLQITLSAQDADIAAIVESTCYQALQKIKTVIEDDCLSDDACFSRIEQIICTLEEIGCAVRNRHDFG